jgi:hypothetical protein
MPFERNVWKLSTRPVGLDSARSIALAVSPSRAHVSAY